MRTTIVNVGTIVSGDWRQPLTDGDSVSMIDGGSHLAGTPCVCYAVVLEFN
jgi:hypothetical protein